jgi:hypothetical protein
MKTIQTIGHTQLTIRRVIALALLLTAGPFMSSYQAHASQITNRSVTLSSSVGAATGVTYSLASSAVPTTGTAIKSVEIQMCTTSSGACTTPTGFTSASSTLASQPTGLGAGSGWTVNTGTAGSLRIVNASNATNPSGAVAVVWANVTNPTATNTTYYGRVTTFSDAAWTTPIDSGTIALSTSVQVQVDLSVGETLTFCTGTSITGQNCATAAGSIVNLGIGSTTSTSTGTSIVAASTNGSSGYTITVNGATLTSGANTVTALTSGATSSVGTKQFGLNVAGANTTPSVGAAVSGTGVATGSANYNTSNTFRFGTGEIIASSAGPTNANAFTVSYIANIDGVTPAGSYTTALTYIATANF